MIGRVLTFWAACALLMIGDLIVATAGFSAFHHMWLSACGDLMYSLVAFFLALVALNEAICPEPID